MHMNTSGTITEANRRLKTILHSGSGTATAFSLAGQSFSQEWITQCENAASPLTHILDACTGSQLKDWLPRQCVAARRGVHSQAEKVNLTVSQ